MKLLRFIKNVWNSVWDATFDGDAKDLVKHMAGCAGGAILLVFLFYILGLFGKWIGLTNYMSTQYKDNTIAIGAILFTVSFMVLILVLVVLNIIEKLIEIWRKS